MTPHEFIAKWKAANLSERSACQQHFLDLCDLLGQPKPADADPDGAWYTFERGVQKTGGGQGWADVWMRGHFGWEYKGKHKDLAAAYQQLLRYREDLENPPLLVVCDLDRFEIHTNFTGTAKRVYAFNLDGLDQPANLDVLRKLFTQPDALRPGQTAESITRQAAERFGLLADGMRQRGIPAPTAAHFLMKLMFCMFAEDIGLLPPKIFHRLLAAGKNDPARLAGLMRNLFAAMAKGGDFGADSIAFFNGGLFADAEVIELTRDEIRELVLVNEHDWASVEPSIFGTLFERTLDPAKRSQIGAHYTSREDIETLLKPVLVAPLLREWDEVRAACDKLWPKIQAAARQSRGRRGTKDSAQRKKFDRLLLDFVERLAHVSVLDPASGSGNFLYVAIHLLLDLNKQVISYAAANGLTLLPQVRPTQLAGLEINPYAQQLAQVVIWIGYLQWMHDNGFAPKRDPVLEPIESIRLTDAILDLSDPEHPKEPEWPKAEFIVGNPPFLGGKLLRANLGDEYVDAMFRVWDQRVPREADLCCYWFERAREAIQRKRCRRAGLLATQGIRGGANRDVLKRIKETGEIFFAESDRPWVLDGANVHVSMVGFDDKTETQRILDGQPVNQINANLGGMSDTTKARRLESNLGLSFMGDTKGGAFDIAEAVAIEFLKSPNPHGRPNSDVVMPWVNGLDVTRRPRSMWIIDFGVDTAMDAAACFQAPFKHVEQNVYPERSKNKRDSYRERWWIHVEPRPAMRKAIRTFKRVMVTISVGKYRIFTWIEQPTLADHQLFAFARSDDYFFGVLHSRLHEVWALKLGTRLETRPRYTPTTCFETFPLPEPSDSQREAIAEAARELDRLRAAWLNPPEWTRTEVLEFPGSVDGPWARYVEKPDRRGIGTVRYPRLAPLDAECAKHLARRTLTNLYNERPTWLDLAHKKLDAAVSAAYGWPADLTDEQILAKLLELNLSRA
jgi:type II restriction/modification system DNA methylase subunit YeeA